MIRDHLIIFFPFVDWDAPWQRYQHFAKEFSKQNKVIYVETPLSIKYLLQKRCLLWKKLTKSLRIKTRITENLVLFHSPPIIPLGTRSSLVNRINQFFLLLLIKFLTLIFKERKNLCLWVSDAIHHPMIRWFNPKISVYDCTDAIIFKNPKEQAFHDELRRRIIIDSDVSFFTSQLYFNEASHYSDTCCYIPNGVDVESFEKEYYPMPRELDTIKKPILGFVGTLDSRIDEELINEILIKKPEVSLVFIGPIIDSLCKLRNGNQVFLLGQKSYEVIPDFINQFDVALIPYRLTENTRYMYPVKMHEYLIMGKPVVSTNLPEVRQFSEVVLVAKDWAEFIGKIGEALRERGHKKREMRIRTGFANSWHNRLQRIESELEKVIARAGKKGI